MKTFGLIVVLLSVGVVAGCRHSFHSGVVGSGKRVMQKRDLSPFTSISTEGAFNIEVICQKPVSVELEADDNIIPLVTTDVSNNILYIKSVSNYSESEPVTLKISVPNLDGINVSGAGTFDISGLKNDKFEIDASGAPTIKASGTTKVIDIDTSGAAKIDTHRLHAARAVVDSKGVSRIELAASDQLDVTISGPSHVTYQGDPVVNQTVHGPGKLEKRTATEGS